jgi:hypothetical protein
LIRRSSCKRGKRLRVQGDKTRKPRVACQFCSRSQGATDWQPSIQNLTAAAFADATASQGKPSFLEKPQTDLRTPTFNSTSPIPDLNINNLIGLQRLADPNAQQRI